MGADGEMKRGINELSEIKTSDIKFSSVFFTSLLFCILLTNNNIALHFLICVM